MTRIAISAFTLSLMIGGALAADMPVKAPPVLTPVFSWTGCYVGGFAGGAWAERDARQTPYYGLPANPIIIYHYSYDLGSSFIGGGTLGCNWQPANSSLVFGLEGEVGYLNLKGSAEDPNLVPGFISSAKIGNVYGAITGRLGFSWNQALIYVKGGAAFINVESTFYSPVVPPVTVDQTVTTWTLGGGLEWAFGRNWSAKVEYMFIGLDRTQSAPNSVQGPTSWNNDIGGIHTAKIGINYRFGGGASLVAR